MNNWHYSICSLKFYIAMRLNNLLFSNLFLVILLNFNLNPLCGQTFNGVGGLPFPSTGTIGITESTCAVTGVGILGGCNIIDNVTVNLNHTFDGDIALMLIAPDGTFIELSSSNGGAGDNYSITVFKDIAAINVVSGAPPFNGDFKPEGRQNTNLSNPYPNAGTPGTFTFANTFNGINADGDWKLYLNDFVPADVGFLNSWSITFSNNGPSFGVNLGPDITACSGANVTLNASNTAPSPTGYAWNTGNNTSSLVLNNITTSGTYTVTVTDQSGCTASDVVVIKRNTISHWQPTDHAKMRVISTRQ
ncbi:MAG: proprotein convertase P-domain-containing protein [Saprospiraceae bacterium]|nr:proprotein convertase P-domain-containing protein [Saprospiraceae bacterium]